MNETAPTTRLREARQPRPAAATFTRTQQALHWLSALLILAMFPMGFLMARTDDSALRATLSKFEHQTGIKTRLGIEGVGVPLAPDVQIHVLHMVQESLSNVRKHAGASQVALHVQRHPYWRFEVADDGAGFDPQKVATDPLHVGLDIMRERAERIAAQLRILSTPGGGGTRVVIELPESRVQQIKVADNAVATLS